MYVNLCSEKTEKITSQLSKSRKSTLIRSQHEYDTLCEMKNIEIGKCYSQGTEIEDCWQSFDFKTHNFHITPINRKIDSDEVKKLKKALGKEFKLKNGKMPWTKEHYWFEFVDEHYCYMLCLQTLAMVEKTINCYLNRIQYYRFPKELGGPNYDKHGNFMLMYPPYSVESGYMAKDNEYCFVVNTGMVLGICDVTNIANGFKQFITPVKE